MIRRLARALREHAGEFSHPERHPELGPFCTFLERQYRRPVRELPPEAWEEALLELIARQIVDGWDAYGAPSAARTPQGPYLASAETPEGPLTVTAESKREAYRRARRLLGRWVVG
ncbi:hypothetical protein, partial [Aliidongia dinghuensis]|uniref:hypothetical protein n=1 Tax=Aliidongia dinghuensis TaxID=1867774 RepID=UPI00166EE895